MTLQHTLTHANQHQSALATLRICPTHPKYPSNYSISDSSPVLLAPWLPLVGVYSAATRGLMPPEVKYQETQIKKRTVRHRTLQLQASTRWDSWVLPKPPPTTSAHKPAAHTDQCPQHGAWPPLANKTAVSQHMFNCGDLPCDA